MTVYVDELKLWLPRQPRPFQAGSCHLSADTLDELHAFARRIGLKRAWFQGHPVMPHYDLTASRRARAIELGAAFVPLRQHLRERRARREEEDRARWLAETARGCRNCPECSEVPCPGCCAGGVCDRMCHCDAYDRAHQDADLDDPEATP